MASARSQKDLMLSGELYYAMDPELLEERMQCRRLVHKFNSEMDMTSQERLQLMQELFGSIDVSNPPIIEPPIRLDYGKNTYIGSGSHINYGCVLLDCNAITIGSRVLIGPNVQLYAAGHPLDPELRNGINGPEFGKPIEIGDDVWIGGGAIILPGVKVGNGSVIGAGAVVTKDVPARVVVVGNPARVVRHIPEPTVAV